MAATARRLAIATVGITLLAPATAQSTVRGELKLERAADGAIVVELRRLHVRQNGAVVDLGKLELFSRAADVTVRAERRDDGSAQFTADVADGPHALFAFVDTNGDGAWSPAGPEPCGWHRRVSADTPTAPITLRAPTHLPRTDRVVAHGALRWRKGLPIVQLAGDARQRGLAHGQLLAPQIIDFFRCYLLEDRLRTAATYERFAAFLQSNFRWPAPLRTELEGVLEGMQASGCDLRVPELGRPFGLTELMAINAYIGTRAMRSSCTQFACWGDRTAGTDVDGGTIAGRNMDGEIDLRRVTVSHFVLFAVAPSEPNQHRYVSMMWPGFVGTLTGFNEHGLHCMENAGGTGPGPIVEDMVAISWSQRQALATLDATAGPADFERILQQNGNSRGGACNAGCIVLFATPNRSNPERPGSAPAWVLEGDRFGHASRLPMQASPRLEHAILASNHHHVYGADPDRPGTYFGRTPSFSSRWRYEAGGQKLASWARTGHKVGTLQMRELLQTVAHGTTEHSVITRPDQREFDVAVASMRNEPWDAPYREWRTFAFDEVFADLPTGTGGGPR